MILKILILILSLIIGFYSFQLLPYIIIGNCESETTIIYDESDKTVISNAKYLIEGGGVEAHFQSTIHLIYPSGETVSIPVRRVLKFKREWNLNSITATTVYSFRVAGPDPKDEQFGKYIDPVAEIDFHSRVYLFVAGNRLLTGFYKWPLSTCNKPDRG